MARTPNDFPVIPAPQANEDVIRADMAAADQVHANVLTLADQLGYDGSLTVGALEDEIRFFQRRSVEALLAVGQRLLLLREMTPHGQFTQRLGLLGFSDRSARRFMQAALKTSKSANLAVLAESVGSASKFLELVTLDDDDLQALKDGGSAAGLTLDDVDRMSASELRAALREAKENEEATGRILAEKNAKLDKLAAEGVKKQAPPATEMWDTQLLGVSDEIHKIGLLADELFGKHVQFIDVCEVVADKLDPDLPDYRAKLEQVRVPIGRLGDQIERFASIVARLRFDFENRVSGYLDRTHVLPEVDAE